MGYFRVEGYVGSIFILMALVKVVSGPKHFGKGASGNAEDHQSLLTSEGDVPLGALRSQKQGNKVSRIVRSMAFWKTRTVDPSTIGASSETVTLPGSIQLPTEECTDLEYEERFLKALEHLVVPMEHSTPYDLDLRKIAICFFSKESVIPKEADRRFSRILECCLAYVKESDSSYSTQCDWLAGTFFACNERYRKTSEYAQKYVEGPLIPEPSVERPQTELARKKHVSFNIPGESDSSAMEELSPESGLQSETYA
ncbi:hypothetical protein RF11_01902 [Thelohanellus kitauei]|uniref:Uncharacterized protein n=1 Tax=Thelohanellus kitauei TaxID=669202 RepID=A0A0C2MHR8_THEKT|nr:hypothetical protein RF11_01902 [Thelohanellus kitauei]